MLNLMFVPNMLVSDISKTRLGYVVVASATKVVVHWTDTSRLIAEKPESLLLLEIFTDKPEDSHLERKVK